MASRALCFSSQVSKHLVGFRYQKFLLKLSRHKTLAFLLTQEIAPNSWGDLPRVKGCCDGGTKSDLNCCDGEGSERKRGREIDDDVDSRRTPRRNDGQGGESSERKRDERGTVRRLRVRERDERFD
ncbi:hypothetical protein MRB53_021313 [Persea americana]|uniref:Uncharacterized protein n=1 Tax=Persea americana TaxID=3435 RepID=A0ACC2L3M9_PERAE|nr:hypothetical protein MRB53_021313 [Persea americana]